MSTDPLDRLERLFRAAQRLPLDERVAFLDEACADDPQLRREVESLLMADEEADAEAFLHTEAGEVVAQAGFSAQGAPESGKKIGPYILMQSLGRGGMGDVYLAQRQEPFKRYVALKIIRRGMDTRDVLQRFEMERHILASLNHANIAQLLDGGMTDEGLPYFAMEYVDGMPLTTYCDRHRLNIRKRIELFQVVCRAVQYAHQNLIIHRDLKPSNILVTKEGLVKLLDFGIAKLLNPHFSPVVIPVTRTELRLMTPEYASPEQIQGVSLTTASDVYALGMILYELLTGHRAYRFKKRSSQEIAQVICEQDPERPSTKVLQTEIIQQGSDTTRELTPTDISMARDMTVDRLQRRLQGDLDNIVLMALRKEPNRRYTTAAQLSEDLDRYLAGRPVMAHRDSRTYRLKKLVRRHRVETVFAVVVVVLLLGGFVLSLWQAEQTRNQRDRAETALSRSEEVTDFLLALFEASDPGVARGEDLRARTLLARGMERAEELAEQPDLQAQMLDVMGRVYQNLGDYETAEQLLARALLLQQTHAGSQSVEAATSLAHSANVFRLKGDYGEAETRYREALDRHRALLGEQHLLVAEDLLGLGQVFQDRGDFEGAEPLLGDALQQQKTLLGDAHPEVLQTQGQLARVLHGKGDYDTAEDLLQQTLASQQEVYGEVHPAVAENLKQLASLYATRDGDFARSETLHRQALAIYEQVYEEVHPTIAKSLTHVATSLLNQQKFEEAVPLLRRGLTIQRTVLGSDHQDVGTALNSLALLLVKQGNLDEAEPLFEEALRIYQGVFGLRHHYTAAIVGNLADIAERRGDLQQAETLFREALAIRQDALDADHPFVTGTQRMVADFFLRTRRFEEAEALYKAALASYQKTQTADKVQVVYGQLVTLYEAWGDAEEAARYRSLQVQDVP